MSIFHNNALVSSSGNQGGGGYEIERSLRFNSPDGSFLSRTPSVAGNRKTWTWAGWVKRSAIGTAQNHIFVAGPTTSSNATYIRLAFNTDDTFFIGLWTTSIRTTSAVFRDPSAWYHIVVAMDTANATEADRCIIYVNGVRQTVSGTVTQNDEYGINAAQLHHIGNENNQRYFNGYLADIHFIDGQALDPSSFGEFDTNGVWQPKAYAGSYGTNGFHLPFSDNSTAAALGTDTSGNSNTWTVNNISVTAGAGNDSLVDTPTSYGTDTGAGGEVRGNYATWNPLKSYQAPLQNGNLYVSNSTGVGCVLATIGISSGRWYWETTVGSSTTNTAYLHVGISTDAHDLAYVPGDDPSGTSWGYGLANGRKYHLGNAAYGATAAANDVIGVAFNADTGSLEFFKNGASQGVAFTSIPSGTYFPAVGAWTDNNSHTNFGQRQFSYAAPAGFKALCTTNLPEPTIADGSTVMDVLLYTGNESTQTVSGLGFSPDLIWTKIRNTANSHNIFDIIRGGSLSLQSNNTNSDQTKTDAITSFNSDGFSVGSNADVNGAYNYVAWTWDAGSSTVTNTEGSITSQVRANASAGFSVVTYTGTGSIGTIGHGLGVAPEFIIVKGRTSTYNWPCYHASLGNTKRIHLNLTNAADVQNTWNNTSPTSSVFSVYAPWLEVNESGINFVAYCFAPVAGYSAFGSYTGNGSADGPFVYTGFRPRWIMVKASNFTTDWAIIDTARETYNPADSVLDANNSGSESTSSNNYVDVLSNGFKLRASTHPFNAGYNYIYAAFASHPLATARAR